MIKKLLPLSLILLCQLPVMGQLVMQQNFESPIPGVYNSTQWYRSCSCISSGVGLYSPHQGALMWSFPNGSDGYLLSPEFVKPNVPYYVSYWVNLGPYSNSDYFAFELRYKDSYGYWHTDIDFAEPVIYNDEWTFAESTIPAGYYGYTMQLRWDGDASLLDDIKVTTTSTIGLSEENFPHLFKIYPNPSVNGDISIAFAQQMEDVTIRIEDISGKLITLKNMNVFSNQNEKVAVGLAKGLYVVTISNTLYSTSQKIVVN